jgi:hypothetical protein
MSIPASINAVKMAGLSDAGPMVATILVRRPNRVLSSMSVRP